MCVCVCFHDRERWKFFFFSYWENIVANVLLSAQVTSSRPRVANEIFLEAVHQVSSASRPFITKPRY